MLRPVGADGGKVLGAGGGGFFLPSAGEGQAERVRATMTALGAAELTFGLDAASSRAVALLV